MSRVPAVIIAAVVGGTVLTACSAGASNPSAAASSAGAGGSASAPATTPGASPTYTRDASADPFAIAFASARPKSSPHAATSPADTSSSPAGTSSSPAGTGSGTDSFTVPPIPGDNVVTGWGSYTKIGTARVKVTMCAKQTGTAFSVGAVALVYNASGASQNIGATILTGPGNTSCVSNTFILYTAHLEVHAFIGGSNGSIVKTGPVLTVY
jgi:hypothetical protein